ncbi:rhamnulokinase [Propionicimonas sp.]|uniref:rhamnulokinase n=1 Tax=Propionicimonas sp. TaxID=1955623 RepID=UPI0039E40C7F
MTARYFAAADLGASSGRVIVGRLEDGRFELTQTARFENGPVKASDGIHTDASGLFAHVRSGIEAAIEASGGALESVGVDTWGVDYGRLDAAGELLEAPFHYRDDRTLGVPELVFAGLPAEELYAAAGLQVMAFNTIFQLVAARDDDRWGEVARVLLMPDLMSYWLSGREVAEVTMASTTGLLDVAARTWSASTCAHLAERYDLPVPAVLPELVEPGTILGPTRRGLFSRPLQVVAVGGHDTASAVASIPARGTDFAFISSGTWSLVGLELEEPVLSPASRAADFTNELGIDGTVRYLKNVMGLWVLSESVRTWQAGGRAVELLPLLAAAAEGPGLSCVLDMTDDRLLPPGDMPSRLRAMAAETGQDLADDPVAICRCILDSLALAYRNAVRTACALAGREVSVVHVVGGGCQNALLCQLTAEAIGLPVVAGPAEGTALGNLLVQARACGALTGDRTSLREVSIASSDLTEYRPGVLPIRAQDWDDAERRARSRR